MNNVPYKHIFIEQTKISYVFNQRTKLLTELAGGNTRMLAL